MYEDADGSPVLVREVHSRTLSVGVDNVRGVGVHLFEPGEDGCRIRDLDGRQIRCMMPAPPKSSRAEDNAFMGCVCQRSAPTW